MSSRKSGGSAQSRTKLRIILLAVLAVLVLAALVIIVFWQALDMDALVRGIKYAGKRDREDFGTYLFSSYGSSHTALWKDGLAVSTGSDLSLLNDDGQTAASLSTSITEPAIKTGRNVTMTYDIGGKNLLAVKSDGSVHLDFSTDGTIFDADISSGDCICISAAEEGYKTRIHCYDASGKETYRWLSSGGYMPHCAITPHGDTLAAVSLGQAEGAFSQNLDFMKTNSEEIQCSVPLGGDLAYDLHFVTDDTVCVVSEKSIAFYTKRGDTRGIYDTAKSFLSDYDFGGEGFVLAALNMYKAGSFCTVASVDYDGEERGSVYLNSDVLDISAAGNYAAVLCRDALRIYRSDMTLYREIPNDFMASSVLMRSDGTAILISGSSGQLCIP